MDIYIGNQTAFSTKDPEEPFKFAALNSFDAFEWFDDKKVFEDSESGWTPTDMSTERRALIKDISESGMRFSVHAPWQANPLKDGGLEKILASLDFAGDIGAKILVIHFYAELGIPAYASAIAPALEMASQLGVQIAIENTPITTPAEFNELFLYLNEHHPDHAEFAGMCLDIGHANCCEVTRNDFIRFIDLLEPAVRIIHCHVHENWGHEDSHLTLFTGPSSKNDAGIELFLARLKKRNFGGSLIMEQWPEPTQMLVEAEKKLRKISGTSRHEFDIEKYLPLIDIAPTEPEDAEDVIAELVVTETSPDVKYDFEQMSSGLAREIVRMSNECTSWRRRLQWLRDVMMDAEFEPTTENLSLIAVYLRYISTGELSCQEDGGHYRPCHHAKAGMDIELRLASFTTSENSWLIRKIYPCLPSHAEEFMRHEPLTRIRDIAHRNDIPHEMKQHIKHSLQNKLHRSAGPEDLITAKLILQDITSEGADYSPSFVEQFKIFYDELKAFFNSPGLHVRLSAIAAEFPESASSIARFVRSMQDADPLKRVDAALKMRLVLADSRKNGMTSAELYLADIELEDYVFVILSDIANHLRAVEGILPGWFSAVLLTLSHISFASPESAEIAIIINELTAWREGFDSEDSFQMLRLKATLERARRYCTDYIDTVVSSLDPAARELGAAFKIEQHAIDVYCEGDIRANIVFQLEKFVDIGISVIRKELHLPAWSVIMTGEVNAEVKAAQTLLDLENIEGRYIAYVEKAFGDEEIPESVVGVILAHAIPQLSHLGVRARQAGVPFVAATDIQEFNELASNVGHNAQLVINEKGPALTPQAPEDSVDKEVMECSFELAEISLVSENVVLDSDDFTVDSCGAKAYNSGLLSVVADKSSGLFSAPVSIAIPFGVMELALSFDSDIKKRYNDLVTAISNAEIDELPELLPEIRKLFFPLQVSSLFCEKVVEIIGDKTPLAIRSSSNGEDFAGLAGAGLYDSVVGVGVDDLNSAIKTVWSSLWTHRATVSRMMLGIEHSDIKMAVLIQPMLEPDYAFVMHTADPVTGQLGRVKIELVVGLGETLVSSTEQGLPYSVGVDFCGSNLEISSLSDYSSALVYDENEGVLQQRVDYSKVGLSNRRDFEKLIISLAKVAEKIENAFGEPQDVEGVICKGDIYVVQSRPQVLLKDEE